MEMKIYKMMKHQINFVLLIKSKNLDLYFFSHDYCHINIYFFFFLLICLVFFFRTYLCACVCAFELKYFVGWLRNKLQIHYWPFLNKSLSASRSQKCSLSVFFSCVCLKIKLNIFHRIPPNAHLHVFSFFSFVQLIE